MKTYAVSGTFDPFTKGHEYLVKELISTYNPEKVIIIICENFNKTSWFSLEKRKDVIEFFLKENKLKSMVEIEMLPFDSYLVDFCHDIGVTHLVRGIRNESDLNYENVLIEVNKGINSSVKTETLQSSSDVKHISSSLVKSLVGYKGWEVQVIKMVNTKAYELFLKREARKHQLFKSLSQDLNLKNVNEIFDKLTESHRFYHNFNHIVDLYEKLELFESLINPRQRSIIRQAVLFHDIVYNPLSSTNEEDSVEFYRKSVQNPNTQVEKLILATKNHNSSVPHEDLLVDIFLDLDLSILGSSESAFKNYENAIREEYKMIPEEIYAVKRNEIMKALKAPYRTELAQNLWGARRVKNLSKY